MENKNSAELSVLLTLLTSCYISCSYKLGTREGKLRTLSGDLVRSEDSFIWRSHGAALFFLSGNSFQEV